ncbi:hypothetical protein VTK26DRAFT_1957 [Humicola hyalothermophila]
MHPITIFLVFVAGSLSAAFPTPASAATPIFDPEPVPIAIPGPLKDDSAVPAVVPDPEPDSVASSQEDDSPDYKDQDHHGRDHKGSDYPKNNGPDYQNATYRKSDGPDSYKAADYHKKSSDGPNQFSSGPPSNTYYQWQARGGCRDDWDRSDCADRCQDECAPVPPGFDVPGRGCAAVASFFWQMSCPSGYNTCQCECRLTMESW